MDLILLEVGDADLINSSACLTTGNALLLDDNGDNIGEKFGIDTDRCIELVSIKQGIQQQMTTDVSNAARTSGRPTISEFTCVKYVDSHSPRFYEYCLRSKLLDKEDSPCRIHVIRSSGDAMVPVLQYELRQVLISEIQFQSHASDMPTEEFKLNFSEISWISNPRTPGDTVATGWNVPANRPTKP